MNAEEVHNMSNPQLCTVQKPSVGLRCVQGENRFVLTVALFGV